MNTKKRMKQVINKLRNSPLTDLQVAEYLHADLDAADYAIVPRKATPEIVRTYLNIQGPNDSGVPVEQHWRTLVAAAEEKD